jgi:uncharacterized membrane protein YbaN (DUF454 family)
VHTVTLLSQLTRECYMSGPPHPPWFDHSNSWSLTFVCLFGTLPVSAVFMCFAASSDRYRGLCGIYHAVTFNKTWQRQHTAVTSRPQWVTCLVIQLLVNAYVLLVPQTSCRVILICRVVCKLKCTEEIPRIMWDRRKYSGRNIQYFSSGPATCE